MLVEVISIHILGKSFCDISRPRLIAGEHRIGWACFCCIHRALCTKSYSLLYAQESKYQLKDAVMYPNPINCGRAERRASWLLLRASMHDAWESKPTMMWEYFTYKGTRNDVRVGVCCVPRCFMRERANKVEKCRDVSRLQSTACEHWLGRSGVCCKHRCFMHKRAKIKRWCEWYCTYKDTRNNIRAGVCCVPRCFMRERADKSWRMPWCIPTPVYCAWAESRVSRLPLQASLQFCKSDKANNEVVWVILHIKWHRTLCPWSRYKTMTWFW